MAKALSCCLPPAQARRFISRICCAASFTLILESIGVEKAGFHAFRRFRTTDMVAKQHAPEELIKFCLGHAASADVTDRYSKLSEDVEFRPSVALSVGLGFELPAGPIVRNVR